VQNKSVLDKRIVNY